MKRTLIYLTITVVILTLITAVLMFSVSGSAPVKLFWAVTCADNNCNLKVSSLNFIGEDEETGNITLAENFTAAGSILPSEAVIDSVTQVPWYDYRSDITTVTLGGEEDEVVPKSMLGWFYGMEKLQEIDFSHVDSYYSTNFSKMFYGCVSLRELDLSPLRIPSKNTTTSEEVFSYTYLDRITFSADTYLLLEYGLWTDEDTGVEYYYAGADSYPPKVPLGKAATYENTTPKFYYKIDNGTLYITSDETILETDSSYKWNYEGAKNTWFDKYTGELTSNITRVVANDFYPLIMYRLFAELTNLTSVDLGNIDTTSTLDMSQLFSGCRRLKTLDLSNVSTESIYYEIDDSVPSDLFESCDSLSEVKINTEFGYPLSEGTWIDSRGYSYTNGLIQTNINETYRRHIMYWGYDASGETLEISNSYVDRKYNGVYYYTDRSLMNSAPWNERAYKDFKNTVSNIIIGSSDSKIEPISMTEWFKGFKDVESIDLSNINGTQLESLDSTFLGMTKLKSIDLSVLDTSHLTSAYGVFANDSALETVNLGNFNSPTLNNVSAMFKGCSKIENIDFSSLSTKNVATYELFSGCSNLRVLNMANFTFVPADFDYDDNYVDMFVGCNKLAQITIGPSNVNYLKTQLPQPDPEYVDGADGKWYDINRNSYTSSQLTAETITTYYAASPKTISFYNGSTLLDQAVYVYGTKIKLPTDFTKDSTESKITTKFISSDGQTFEDVNSTKTTSYKLVEFTNGTGEDAVTYEAGGDYTVTRNETLYTVFEEDEETYSSIVLPDASRFGYNFVGWVTEENGTGGLEGGYSYTPTQNTTLYASWEQIVHEFIDNTDKERFVQGVTKELVFRIDGELSKFKDLYVGEHLLTRNTHYTATSGSTVITFTEEGLNYINNLEPKVYEIRALFTDTEAVGVSSLSIAEPQRPTLLIHYKYSGSRSNEKVFDDYSTSVKEGDTYSVTSKKKDYYEYDKEVVNGTMGTTDVEVTVTYTPKNDKNNNDKADEEEVKEQEQNNSSNNSSNTNNNTSNDSSNKSDVVSPKTRDDILTYIILELISVVVGVIIFIRIKAH